MENSQQTKFEPTREQLLAYTTDRHISVAANAGSGKTAVLTDRYIDILLKHIRNGQVEQKTFAIDNIVAITFTRKATGEMRERIASKLDNLLENPDNQQDWKGLKQLRERFSSARISTIDSFCTQILREYPLQAGINPAFSIIESFKESLLIRKHIHSVLEDILEKNDDRSTLLRKYIFCYSRETLEDIIRRFMSDPLHLQKLHKLYNTNSDQDFLNKRAALLKNIARSEAHNLAEKIQELVTALDAYKDGFQVCNQAIQALNYCIAELNEIHRIGDTHEGTSLFQRLLNIVAKYLNEKETAYKKLFGAKGTINGSTQRKLRKQAEADGSLRVIEGISTYIAIQIKEIAEKYPNQEAIATDGEMFATMRFLFAIAEEVAKELNEEKDSLAQYSFADIMAKALTLLAENDTVRAEVQSTIQYLMIDEFQDTNPVQLQLAKLLVPALDNNCPLKLTEKERFSHTNLFIVGDPKQSIYRFRSADVRVFKEAQDLIRKVNREAIENGFISGTEITVREKPLHLTTEEAEGYLFLTSSFRMNASIAGFVNTLCGTMMQSQESDYDVAYQAIICGKADLFENNLPISFVEYSKEKEPDTLPKLLASFTEEQRTNTAVLAGSNNKLIELSKQLQQYNIPFTISSGTFYESEEFGDILSILQFLINSANNAACVAVLRSPMFGIDDTTLLTIASLKQETFWQGVITIATKLNEEQTNLTSQETLLLRAHKLLSNILNIAPRLDPATLIRTILADTNWKAIIATRDKAVQMEANMEKIIDIIRDIDKKGFISLANIVEELEELKASESRVKQAEVEQQDGCVSLMTVHSSKGLEFDTVICSDLTKPQNGGDKRKLLFDDDLGLVIKETVRFNSNKTTEKIRGGAYFIADMNEEFAEQAEYKRLIYVATTRPKHKLIVSQGRGKDSKGQDQELKQSDFLYVCREIKGNKNSVETTIGTLENNEVVQKDFTFAIDEITIPESNPLTKLITEKELTETDILFAQPYASTVTTEVFTPSMCILFQADKEAFLQRYRLGLQEEETEYRHDITDDFSDENAAEYGTYFHAVLQHIPVWLTNNTTVHQAEYQQALLYATNTINRTLKKQEEQRFEKEFSALTSSSLFQEYTSALLSSTTEYAFFVPIGTDFVRGTIDVFLQKDEKTAEVWDWKTNYAPNPEDKDSKLAYYEIQLKIYILVLSRIYPTKEYYRGKIIFTRYTHTQDYVREIAYSASDIPLLEQEIINVLEQMRLYSFGI